MVGKMKPLVLKYKTCLELCGTPPFNFEKTVRKYTLYGVDWFWLTPFEIYSRNTLWTATKLSNEIPVGLRLESLGDTENPRISLTAFCEHPFSSAEVKEVALTISWSLGLKKDISEFYDLAENHIPLRKAKTDLFGMRIAANPRLIDLVLLAHTLQAASYGRTEKMLRLIYSNYGELLEFDGKRVHVSPSPKKIAETSKNELMSKCKLGYRTENILFNSSLIAYENISNLLDLEKMPMEEAKKIIQKMKGLGEYSREVIFFAIHPCFPVDSWSVNFFVRLFGLNPTGNTRKLIKAVKDFVEKAFGKWQSYAYDYLINDIEQLSKEFSIDF
jgi:DNA-3-methyladenine glycosylase II